MYIKLKQESTYRITILLNDVNKATKVETKAKARWFDPLSIIQWTKDQTTWLKVKHSQTQISCVDHGRCMGAGQDRYALWQLETRNSSRDEIAKRDNDDIPVGGDMPDSPV